MFQPEQLFELNAELSGLHTKADNLMLQLISHQYRTSGGREYAHNGLARRIQTIARCIERIYELLPPETVEIPQRDTLYDAMINIQAAVFNVYGSLDNLAFIWVFEKSVSGKKGNPLPNDKIGLTHNHKEVWNSLPLNLQAELTAMTDWLANLKAFRHSLGHRVPLYIPPYCIDPSNIEKYRELETKRNEALRARNFDEYELLEKTQHGMRHFKPLMQHSLFTDKPPIVFHSQLLADFNTVEHIARKFLAELN